MGALSLPLRVRTRQDLIALFPRGGRIAEVGVFAGHFAADILRICQPSALHLIDPWRGPMCSADQNGWHTRQVADAGVLYAALDALYAGDDLVTLHRGRSADVLPTFPARSLDLVYLDGDHTYRAVLLDLVLAAVCARDYVAGHDYCDAHPGVVRAVDEFCAAQPWRIVTLTTDDGMPSYLLERTT